MDKKFACQAVLLAAGRSTRFKTKKSKLLFNICGRSMILYPIIQLQELGIETIAVLGYQAEQVQEEIQHEFSSGISIVIQEEQRGTGHAVAQTKHSWQEETILVLSGDTPLITAELLEKLCKTHKEKNATIPFLTTQVIDPTG